MTPEDFEQLYVQVYVLLSTSVLHGAKGDVGGIFHPILSSVVVEWLFSICFEHYKVKYIGSDGQEFF